MALKQIKIICTRYLQSFIRFVALHSAAKAIMCLLNNNFSYCRCQLSSVSRHAAPVCSMLNVQCSLSTDCSFCIVAFLLYFESKHFWNKSSQFYFCHFAFVTGFFSCVCVCFWLLKNGFHLEHYAHILTIIDLVFSAIVELFDAKFMYLRKLSIYFKRRWFWYAKKRTIHHSIRFEMKYIAIHKSQKQR